MAKAKASEKSLATYEAMFLFGANAATDADGAVNTAKGIIERHEGQILVIKKWDERKLTYEIKRQKRGTYIICFFTAPGAAVTGIERDVKLSDDVLRVLITRADHLNETEMAAVEPQPIVREERPSFDRPWESRGGDRGGDRGDRGGDRGSDRGDRGGDRGGDRPAPRAPRRDEGAPAGGDADAEKRRDAF